MTLASELATHGYNATDITNMIVEAYDILSLHAGSTITENSSEDWDRIAKIYTIYLLDRLRKVRQSLNDSGVVVPPMMSDEISMLINKLILEPEDREDLLFLSSNTPIENYYNPAIPRS